MGKHDLLIKRVNDFLQAHIGRDRAITIDNIVAQMGLRDDGKTQYAARKLLKQAMVELGLPIASCSKGYFIANTQDENVAYVESLRKRIAGTHDRINRFKDAVRGYWK